MEVVHAQSPLTLARSFDLGPHLHTQSLARVLEVHPSLGSTNARALHLARQEAAHGLAVLALHQTEGRGQRGRRWFSPAGAGLYVSFVLRPMLSPRLTPSLTLVAGVAVRQALEAMCGVDVKLRWPNDIVSGPSSRRPGRKVAGILVEASADQTRLEYAVVGVGINLEAAAYPPGLQPAVTSLSELQGDEAAPSLAVTLGAVCDALESALVQMEAKGLGPAAQQWTQHAVGLGTNVEMMDGQRCVKGRLLGIAEDGALRLQTASGVEHMYRGDLKIPGLAKTPREF